LGVPVVVLREVDDVSARPAPIPMPKWVDVHLLEIRARSLGPRRVRDGRRVGAPEAARVAADTGTAAVVAAEAVPGAGAAAGVGAASRAGAGAVVAVEVGAAVRAVATATAIVGCRLQGWGPEAELGLISVASALVRIVPDPVVVDTTPEVIGIYDGPDVTMVPDVAYDRK
jgi:hypothetical protein